LAQAWGEDIAIAHTRITDISFMEIPSPFVPASTALPVHTVNT
jgi:hypothetical protein